jgi:TolB-like protein
MPLRRFYQELKDRHVIRVGLAYAVGAWLLVQIADTLLPIYHAPDWLLPTFTTLLFLGFPVALFLAWAFDIKPAKKTGFDPAVLNQSDSESNELAMPEGPSVVVLPFKDLSGESGGENFAWAVTNDIATGLTQSSSLRVVSSEAREGMRDTASLVHELGVRYVLEGTVNRVGDSLRITAQLTDGRDASRIWSEKYDKRLTADNLFNVQDDICTQIVATLGDFHGVIFSSETKKNIHRPTDSLTAYECLSVALAYDKYLTEEYHLRARESLERAVKIDAEFDAAWAHLSWIYTDEVIFGYNPLPDSMERALKAARRGVELAPDNYHNHWLLSRVHYFSGNREQFISEAEKALNQNSNDGTTLGLIGGYMALAGQWERGVALVRKAQALNPRHPDYYY